MHVMDSFYISPPELLALKLKFYITLYICSQWCTTESLTKRALTGGGGGGGAGGGGERGGG